MSGGLQFLRWESALCRLRGRTTNFPFPAGITSSCSRSEIIGRRGRGKKARETGQFSFFFRACSSSMQKKTCRTNGTFIPSATRCAQRIKNLTNINILHRSVVVNLESTGGMCKYPYVFMTSEGDFNFVGEKTSRRCVSSVAAIFVRPTIGAQP